MKIAVFCDLLPTLLNLRGRMVRRMSELSDEVIVVAQPADAELIHQLREECNAGFFPVEMDRTGMNPIRDNKYRKTISKFLSDFKPDHTFAFQAKAAVYSSIAAKSFPNIKTTVLFPGLGYLFSENGSFKDQIIRMLGKQLYRYAFNQVDNFIFQNPDDIETLRSANIIKDNSDVTLVNGSGVPLDQYQVADHVLEPLRFLFMGRLLWEKGVQEFCDAARIVNEKFGGKTVFQILGPLDSNPSAVSKAELDKLCNECGVEYLGVTKDVRPYLAKASVFVLPSYYMEGTPRSILESMSMGRPIISADSRGCREPVENGINGYLVPPRDSSGLADAIQQFVVNPELVETMGKSSRKIAEDKYDVEKVNQSIMVAMGLV